MWGREVQVCAASHLRLDARETFRKRRGCSGAVTGSPACTQSSGCARGVLSACKKGWSPIGQASGPRVRGAVVQGVVRLGSRLCASARGSGEWPRGPRSRSPLPAAARGESSQSSPGATLPQATAHSGVPQEEAWFPSVRQQPREQEARGRGKGGGSRRRCWAPGPCPEEPHKQRLICLPLRSGTF